MSLSERNKIANMRDAETKQFTDSILHFFGYMNVNRTTVVIAPITTKNTSLQREKSTLNIEFCVVFIYLFFILKNIGSRLRITNLHYSTFYDIHI